MNITSSSLQSYGNTHVVNGQISQNIPPPKTNTGKKKIKLRCSWMHLGCTATKQVLFRWSKPLSLFDWQPATVPLHARSAWQGQTEVVISNISSLNIVNQAPMTWEDRHQCTALVMALLYRLHWIETESSQLKQHWTSIYFSVQTSVSTQWKKTTNVLLQLPAQWSSPLSLGQLFQTIQLQFCQCLCLQSSHQRIPEHFCEENKSDTNMSKTKRPSFWKHKVVRNCSWLVYSNIRLLQK